MNWRHIWLVMRKELVDALRDKRTWMAMIVIPLIVMPAVTLAGPAIISSQSKKAESAPPAVVIVGEAPQLRQFLGQSGGFVIADSADPTADLSAGRIQLIVDVPAGFEAALANETPTQLGIKYDGSDMRSETANDRLREALSQFTRAIVTARLTERALDPTLLQPFAVSASNVAPPARMSGMFFGMVLPMLLGTWAATGGTWAAIDAGAGEKERGTLEALLTVPASRLSLVLGKYFVVTLVSLVASLISLLGVVVGYRIGGSVFGLSSTFTLSVSPAMLALMFMISATIAASFAALELAVSIYARSFKEAQNYMSPIAILMVLPGLLTQAVSPREASLGIYCVPVLNVIFTLKELVIGIVDWSHIGITLAVSVVMIAVALRIAVWMFNREEVLFRS